MALTASDFLGLTEGFCDGPLPVGVWDHTLTRLEAPASVYLDVSPQHLISALIRKMEEM